MRKPPLPKLQSKTFATDPDDTLYIGVDVHKHTYQVAVWSVMRNGPLAAWVAPADAGALCSALESHRDNIAHIVYEAGPTGFHLARTLAEASLPVDVISASHLPSSPGQEEKSDRLDARHLAFYASREMVQPVYVPSVEEESDRALVRRRATITKEVTRTKVRIKQTLLFHGVPEPEGLRYWSKASRQALAELSLAPGAREALDGLLRDLDHFEGERKRIDRCIADLGEEERYRQSQRVLQTIPGVGLLTAMVFLTEFVHPERFDNREEVGKMLGLAPCIRSSGLTRHENGRLRGGSARLRRVLVEAAWQWVSRDEGAKQKFKRLLANTGERKKAIVAMARKLGILMWRMTLRGEPYRSNAAAAA